MSDALNRILATSDTRRSLPPGPASTPQSVAAGRRTAELRGVRRNGQPNSPKNVFRENSASEPSPARGGGRETPLGGGPCRGPRGGGGAGGGAGPAPPPPRQGSAGFPPAP